MGEGENQVRPRSSVGLEDQSDIIDSVEVLFVVVDLVAAADPLYSFFPCLGLHHLPLGIMVEHLVKGSLVQELDILQHQVAFHNQRVPRLANLFDQCRMQEVADNSAAGAVGAVGRNRHILLQVVQDIHHLAAAQEQRCHQHRTHKPVLHTVAFSDRPRRAKVDRPALEKHFLKVGPVSRRRIEFAGTDLGFVQAVDSLVVERPYLSNFELSPNSSSSNF